MRYDNLELHDRLAADYVMGTLRGAARRRFEGLMAASITLRRAVHRWEQRLFWLSMRLPPVPPPTAVWTRIEQQIAPVPVHAATPFAPQSRLWQALAAGIAVVAVLLGTLLITRPPVVQVQVEKRAVEAAHTAIVEDSAAAPIWVVNAYPDVAELRVRAMRAVDLADNQSFELWMLPDSGASPVSLGVMPRTGSVVLPVSAEQLRVLALTSKLAVSIEPAGGSPTGAPTGPIPYSAPLLHTDTRA
jgi:anti-sigma-K factor RskA